MIAVGIDPGLDGGLTALESRPGELHAFVASEPMPTLGGSSGKRVLDIHGIKRFLAANKPDLVVLEKVGAMPGQGVTSMFNFGYVAGLVEGVVFTLGLRVEFVQPQVWQRLVFKGIPRDNAKPSMIFCQRMFPSVDWRGSERSRTPHDGKTDSCCLAYYGLAQYS